MWVALHACMHVWARDWQNLSWREGGYLLYGDKHAHIPETHVKLGVVYGVFFFFVHIRIHLKCYLY